MSLSPSCPLDRRSVRRCGWRTPSRGFLCSLGSSVRSLGGLVCVSTHLGPQNLRILLVSVPSDVLPVDLGGGGRGVQQDPGPLPTHLSIKYSSTLPYLSEPFPWTSDSSEPLRINPSRKPFRYLLPASGSVGDFSGPIYPSS